MIRSAVVTRCAVALTFLAPAAPTTWAADNAAYHAAVQSIQTSDLDRHIGVLADDTFEGRAAGSRGGHAAAGYLAKELSRLKLKPAGANGSFYQPFSNSRNVLAMIPGTDPELKDEWIVVGAHYDHVGYGTARNSYGPTGYIHNGADDNASGSSGLLEVAEAFTQLPSASRRGIVFAWWDGEEAGLLGSKHWMSQPTVPLKNVVLGINVDMIGRMRNNSMEIGGTRTGYNLRRLAGQNAVDTPLQIDFHWKHEANSDHWSFYERNIPYLLFHTGLHNDYHRPSDDVEKINLQGAADASKLLFQIVHDAANRDARPNFRAASRSESSLTQRSLEAPLPLPRPRLGVRWDETDKSEPGLRLIEVVANSPAAKAGLQADDRLLTFQEVELEDGEQMRSLVAAAPAEVEVTLQRGDAEEPLTLPIELAGQGVRVGLSWRVDEAEPQSVLLTLVVSGSPSEKAGLQVRDRVYQVGGRDFANSDEFLALIQAAEGPTELLVEQRGRVRKLTIDLPPAVKATQHAPSPELGS